MKVNFPFKFDKFYRYFDINQDMNLNIQLLEYFYGEDRSYRLACPFDNGDFIIEFDLKENYGNEISHHPLCYRGLLSNENVIITNIFVNNKMSDFHDVNFLENYKKKINLLINNLSKDNKKLVKYYDQIIETDYKYLPMNDFTKIFKSNLIYQGLN
tara:strand:+ start:655 stop:1122 length:468 start_codon:yes stop_codon:yes gene_type:complete